MGGFTDSYGVELTNLDGEDDHVHVPFRAKPTTDLVKFINTVKGATARRIRNEFADELRTELWGDSFWNDSYCLISTGQVSLDVLQTVRRSPAGELMYYAYNYRLKPSDAHREELDRHRDICRQLYNHALYRLNDYQDEHGELPSDHPTVGTP